MRDAVVLVRVGHLGGDGVSFAVLLILAVIGDTGRVDAAEAVAVGAAGN